MHGGNLRWAKENYRRDEFIDLSANINPFGPPPGVWQTLQHGLKDIVHYPDPESKEFITALASHLELDPKWIMAGNGAGELIFTIMQRLKPREVVIPIPAFSEYERAARAGGAKVNFYSLGAKGWSSFSSPDDEENYEHFASTWHDAIGNSDLLFLCSPHNPTGSVIEQAHFERLLDLTRKKDCKIVFDESFYDFLPLTERWSGRSYLKDNPHLIVLYSLTKFYSIPGLRLGAAFAHPELLGSCERFRDPWSVNVLAQKAGIAALNDRAFAPEVQERVTEARKFLYAEFAKRSYAHFKLLPSKVNFALIKLEGFDSTDLTHELARRGILVRDCKSFSGLDGDYIRIAIKDIPSMRRLINELDDLSV